MQVNADVFVSASYMRGSDNKPFKTRNVSVYFQTEKPASIWHNVKFIEIRYAGQSKKLVPQYVRSVNSTVLEQLSLSLPLQEFIKMVKTGGFSATINSTSVPLTGESIFAFNKLLGSMSTPTNNVVRLSPPAKQKLTSRQIEFAKSALKSIRKLEAATKVGVSYNDYNSRLIDTQADVDEYTRELPKSNIRNEIEQAMKTYVSAGALWKSYMRIDITVGGNSTGDFLNRAWAQAKEHTRKAEKLL